MTTELTQDLFNMFLINIFNDFDTKFNSIEAMSNYYNMELDVMQGLVDRGRELTWYSDSEEVETYNQYLKIFI